MTLGEKIKKLLEEKNISQRELADKAGITEVTMSRIIRDNRIPKATVLIAIAKALDTDPEDLFQAMLEDDLGIPTVSTGSPELRMDRMVLKVQLDPGAYLPERAYPDDAGADLRTPVAVIVHPDHPVTVHTGVHVEIPRGYFAEVKSRSGMMMRYGIVTDGTVDAGYSGEICVELFALGGKSVAFQPGDKIAQLVVQRVETPAFIQVEKIEGGPRGNKGFGSTGR